MDDAAFLGRLHPLLVHLPIGLLLGVVVLEILAARKALARPALGLFLWLAALSAVFSASAGWVLSHEEGYGGDTLERHERLGMALAAAAVLAALLHDPRGRSVRIGLYRAALGVACVLLVPAGHLGSTLTHGADWLDGPRSREEITPLATVEVETTAVGAETVEEERPEFDAVFALFEARCTSCHGATKRKGELRLDSRAAMLLGGGSGPALVPGDAAESLLFRRASLPLEHEDHMPPEGKPQPTADELALLEAWIAAGAPERSGPAPEPDAAPEGGEDRLGEEPHVAEPGPVVPAGPPPELLAALERAFLYHEFLDEHGNELRVEVLAVATSFGESELAELLEPLAPWIVDLVLARSRVDDASLARLARFSALRHLDLRATPVSDAGLAALRGHGALVELNLAQTRLSDGAVESLLSIPGLARLALWDAGLSEQGLARLRATPGLRVLAGDEPDAEVLETEGELTFSSDRALPGAERVPEALRPVNTRCPVSGDPLNPKYTLVHTFADGTRVIGFCCPNCPGEFWSDPEKFAAALR